MLSALILLFLVVALLGYLIGVYNGLVRRETPDEVVLATSATEDVRVARQDIDEVEPGKVSIMPAGLDQQLARQELADLVAFLKACK